MSANESGVYTTVDTSGILPTIGISGGTIGLIGHVDLNATGIAAYTEFTTGVTGSTILIGNHNFADWVGTNVDLETSAWSDGESTTPTGSYDSVNNAIRALELIFLGNANAVVRLCILDSGGSPTAESTADDGLAEALNELLKFDDVTWIHVAGKVPLSSVQSHVATASSNTYGAERVYVAGLDFMHVYDDTMALTIGSTYTNLQTTNGRTVVFCTKANYVFNNATAANKATQTVRHCGGNILSAYLLGMLSGTYEYEAILRRGFAGFTQTNITSDWSEFVIPLADREDFASESIIYIRRQNNRDFFEIGRAFTGGGSAYDKITTRRIMDTVIKSVRTNLYPFLGRPINNTILSSAETIIDTVLSRLAGSGYIDKEYDKTVYTTTQDAIDGIIRCNVTVSPSTYIQFIYVTISAV